MKILSDILHKLVKDVFLGDLCSFSNCGMIHGVCYNFSIVSNKQKGHNPIMDQIMDVFQERYIGGSHITVRTKEYSVTCKQSSLIHYYSVSQFRSLAYFAPFFRSFFQSSTL